MGRLPDIHGHPSSDCFFHHMVDTGGAAGAIAGLAFFGAGWIGGYQEDQKHR